MQCLTPAPEGFAKKCRVPAFWQNTPQRAAKSKILRYPLTCTSPMSVRPSVRRAHCAVARVGRRRLAIPAGCHLKAGRWQTLSHVHIPLSSHLFRRLCTPRLPTRRGASGVFFSGALKLLSLRRGIWCSLLRNSRPRSTELPPPCIETFLSSFASSFALRPPAGLRQPRQVGASAGVVGVQGEFDGSCQS
jgi:hypothetical protein